MLDNDNIKEYVYMFWNYKISWFKPYAISDYNILQYKIIKQFM